ncbi:MAG: hypothetical protein A3D34_02965 [Candidatus Staskawiczbacteria bacterium RIFCSPHIGHO2_02_FULL_33_16]|uniref:Glycosyl transferase n=1 Tax=Candidatus Staskawiczbacteria bacterium RIFCSPHIGHO2_02_FULL_33_16 TaxID=1802204 RepID=A0A1G2HW97_9BACT|nr:MAG: hypothetical protein A3D34_02965 [Candidatus Staskawiczbacteria bacterium RIFCSPHIGHO2_02_FULL_33_16]
MIKKEKVTITFFLPSLECGGTERNTVNLLKNLNKENYALSLLLAEKKGDFIKDVPKEIPIVSFNAHSLFKIFLHLIAYFKEEKADIFVSAFPRFNAIVLLAKKFSGTKTKIIITEHLSFSLLSKTAKTVSHRFIARFLFPSFIKLFYPNADAIICVSKGIAQEISSMAGHLEKIKVIYNPVADHTILEKAKAEVSHTWFHSTEIPVILMVGRLSKTKDQPTLFRALSIILKKQPAHLVIVGDGTEKLKLINLATQLNLTENIAFLGFQDNPYKYMKRASVFVLSSLQEGFGNVIVEAMACGTPVVATNCASGPSEIIQDRINGLLVAPQNEEALASLIIKVLNNPSLAKTLSIEGKKRSEFFSIKKSVEEYEKIFQTISLTIK